MKRMKYRKSTEINEADLLFKLLMLGDRELMESTLRPEDLKTQYLKDLLRALQKKNQMDTDLAGAGNPS